jgi:transposase-like protein
MSEAAQSQEFACENCGARYHVESLYPIQSVTVNCRLCGATDVCCYPEDNTGS